MSPLLELIARLMTRMLSFRSKRKSPRRRPERTIIKLTNASGLTTYAVFDGRLTKEAAEHMAPLAGDGGSLTLIHSSADRTGSTRLV